MLRGGHSYILDSVASRRWELLGTGSPQRFGAHSGPWGSFPGL